MPREYLKLSRKLSSNVSLEELKWYQLSALWNELQQQYSQNNPLRDIVPDTDIHLIVYPVIGTENVSHYLVETTDDSSRKKRRRGNSDEALGAIG